MTKKAESSKPSKKAKILLAARELFVKNGFHATSMSEIAKLAGVNQSLIHHHYDTKQNLWENARDDIFSDYSEKITKGFDDLIAKHQELDSFLEGIIRLRFELIDKDPEVRRMLLWHSVEVSSFAEVEKIYTGKINNHLCQATNRICEHVRKLSPKDQADRAIFQIDSLFVLMSNWYEGRSIWLYHIANLNQNDKVKMRDAYQDFLISLVKSNKS